MLYAPEFVTAEVAYRQDRVGATFTAIGRSRRRSGHLTRRPRVARHTSSTSRRAVATQ